MFLVSLARKYRSLGHGVKFLKTREINGLVKETLRG
jgi:hypothetical protein